MSRTDQDNSKADELRSVVEKFGGQFDPRFGKAAGIAAASFLSARANPLQLRKSSKAIRKHLKDTVRYVRKHPWESAALLIASGVATMKAMEAHREGNESGTEAEEAAPLKSRTAKPRGKRASKATRKATRH